jgi:glyoxylase-like metal-dependent hydrolase (beta-lactamase superfamily II)
MTRPVIETIPVGPLQCNCSILVDPETREALVIDPGGDADRILMALARERAKPVALLHTHAHFDHILGTAEVARVTQAPARLHPGDRPLYDSLPDQAALFGFRADPPSPLGPPLTHDEAVPFGSLQVRAIHTPGHTPGSTSFLLETEKPVLFAGDTLFRRSIGRTDLWGGDTDQILDSIKARLYTLPDETPVVCGHGPGTTIGEEKRSNPFVRA